MDPKTALVPGTPFTVPEFMQHMAKALGPNGSQGFGPPGGSPMPGVPMNPMQMGAPPPPQGVGFRGQPTGAAGAGAGGGVGTDIGAYLAALLPQMRPPQGQAPGFMRGGYPEHLIHGMPTRYAHGSYVAPDGQGDGRSDHVNAKLSPGEYVVDAETLALLGNGDNDAGARQMDKFREGIRKQKGRALAKGKFSPDAKAPTSYMQDKG
jgi:hypothetical protein